MQGEKRSSPRKHLEYPAGLDFGDGRPPRACVLSDISKTGARIRVDNAADMPEQVTLLLSRNGVMRRCRVAWTEGQDVGLEFVREPPPAPPPRPRGPKVAV
jgi:hypothetical protein